MCATLFSTAFLALILSGIGPVGTMLWPFGTCQCRMLAKKGTAAGGSVACRREDSAVGNALQAARPLLVPVRWSPSREPAPWPVQAVEAWQPAPDMAMRRSDRTLLARMPGSSPDLLSRLCVLRI
jgi:hypothetical protein